LNQQTDTFYVLEPELKLVCDFWVWTVE